MKAQNYFPVVKITETQEIEQLGTKEKYWIYCPETDEKKLFKIGRENTGEDWAEVAAYEIGKLLNLPVAKYEFAEFKGRIGTLSTSFLTSEESLIHGNELLAEVLENYPTENFYQVKEYKLNSVIEIINTIDTIENSEYLKQFFGYLIFDCLIANQDRHHENWAFIWDGNFNLAPTYDHAAGFGCREMEERIEQRLITKDKNYTVDAYSKRARTPFHNALSKKMLTIEVCQYLASINIKYLCHWLNKINILNDNEIKNIFNRIPEKLITENQRVFAFEIIKSNTRRLLELKHEVCKNVD